MLTALLVTSRIARHGYGGAHELRTRTMKQLQSEPDVETSSHSPADGKTTLSLKGRRWAFPSCSGLNIATGVRPCYVIIVKVIRRILYLPLSNLTAIKHDSR